MLNWARSIFAACRGGNGLRAPIFPQSVVPSLDINDLLGRETINLDTPEMQRFLAGRVILVTGAGGSIGSEICRQMMRFCPQRLILLDQAENALFEIDRELRERWVGSQITPVVADIGDVKRINNVFHQHQPQVVFHAAAHKHVPMMELNPGEAVKNNVIGAKNVADASLAHNADAFVLISTDKAVNPTSVMGAAKRCAELYVQSLNHKPQNTTRFVAVRFGNVLGSSGSVVPIFQKQIAAGGPITVTHPEMRRFFMTIPEAAQLVMQAAAIARGGEIFVLDMGQLVKIIDLAKEMLKRTGLTEDDIPIVFTGVRPGEKLYEELANDTDRTMPTAHEKIRVWRLPTASPEQTAEMIRQFQTVIDSDGDAVRGMLKRFVPEYQSPAIPVSTMRLVADSAAA